jgi:hypothetical protein
MLRSGIATQVTWKFISSVSYPQGMLCGLEVSFETDFVLAELATSVRRLVCVTHVLLPSLA